jgi:hypothetical protein
VERIALLVLKCFNTLGLSVLQIGCSSFDRTLVGTWCLALATHPGEAVK